jgi:hypothetical protein
VDLFRKISANNEQSIMMIPGENAKEGVAPSKEYRKMLEDIDQEVNV